VEWAEIETGIEFRLRLESEKVSELSPVSREHMRHFLVHVATIFTSILRDQEALTERGANLEQTYGFLARYMGDIARFYETWPDNLPDRFDADEGELPF
jgi:hypothetical protein